MQGYKIAEPGETAKARTIEELARAISAADAIVVGAGAGLSTAAGMEYGGERFRSLFADFEEAYGFHDMYAGSFHPFETPEESWAYMSRMIMANRYVKAPGTAYGDLLALVGGKDHFVITTNVDHQFQLAGFDKRCLFYTQGDYGLWQCSAPCHDATYDNEAIVRRMAAEQRGMRVPAELVPTCPKCGRPMSMNLRSDSTFVEDAGWREAAARYERFLNAHAKARVLYLELGVGFNTPGIVKYPFWQLTAANPRATYACVNLGDALCPDRIADRSILVDGDIQETLAQARACRTSRPVPLAVTA